MGDSTGARRADWLYVWQFAAVGAFLGGAGGYAAGAAWPSYWGHGPQQALEAAVVLFAVVGPLIGVVGASILCLAWREWSAGGVLCGGGMGYLTYLIGLFVGGLISGRPGGQDTVGWAFAAGTLLTILCPVAVIQIAGRPPKRGEKCPPTPPSTGD